MTSLTSPDVESVKNLLYEINKQLGEQDTNAAKENIVQLTKVSQPAFVFELLAPCLFFGTSAGSLDLDHKDALSIVTFLAVSDPTTYYKPASREIKKLAEKLVSGGGSLDQHPTVSDELLAVLVEQLSGKDIEVSSNATSVLVACSRRLGPPFTRRAVPSIVECWKTSMNSNVDRQSATTISVRCASTVTDLSCLSEEAMDVAIETGATDLLLMMLSDDSDPLVQVSVLDLLEKAATTLPIHGRRAQWLFSSQVIHPLLEMTGGSENGEYADAILGGPALKLLSALCRLSQRDATLFDLAGGSELLTGFHKALGNFDGKGELDRLALIDAISSFAGASPHALQVVLDDTNTREAWLSLNVAQPKLKSVILVSAAMVIDPPAEVDVNGDNVVANIPSNASSMKLYSSLGQTNNQDTTELLLSLAKSPVVETRLGAYALLRAVAKRGTGAQVLLSHADFYEFLVSREGERTKEGKEAKFEIVDAVMKSEVRGLLADDIVRSLEKILQQGPHYVQAQRWDVATE